MAKKAKSTAENMPTMATVQEAVDAITDAINKDLTFYTSDFCRNELDAAQRKVLLQHMQGKKEALELITGKKYKLSADGLQEKEKE